MKKNIYLSASLFILISILVGTKLMVSAASQIAPITIKGTAQAINPVGAQPATVTESIPEQASIASGNVLLMAGDICKYNEGLVDDIANCRKTGDLIRSQLAANPGAQVQTLGDNVNNDVSKYSYAAEYRICMRRTGAAS